MIDVIRRGIVPIAGSALLAGMSSGAGPTQREPFVVSVVVSDLDTPWDLAWGPDNVIWFSDRGGRISRLDPATGRRTTAGTLAVHQNGEGGLMGLPSIRISPARRTSMQCTRMATS